jgi:isopenicillin-N N-acyltransferase-like protein
MEDNRLTRVFVKGHPVERGVQYGQRAKALIEQGIGSYQLAFQGASGVSWEKALDFSRTFVTRIKEYDETLLEELRGIAKGSDRAFEEILTINLRTEILFGLRHAAEGCTSFAALPEITSDGHTLLGQNWDYKPFASETMILLQITPDQGPDILTIAEAGQLARMGMNSAGLGICNNYIECESDGKNMEQGIPTTLIRRRALGQETYHALLATIIHTRRSFSGNYLVATAEAEGDAIDIEATPQTAYFVYPADGLVAHSNHIKGNGPGYVGAVRPGVENSLYRDRRLEKNLRRKPGVGVPEVQAALSDHFGYPLSVCRHPEDTKPWYDQWRTNTSVIMDLTDRVMWASAGPPCENKYHRYTFEVEG